MLLSVAMGHLSLHAVSHFRHCFVFDATEQDAENAVPGGLSLLAWASNCCISVWLTMSCHIATTGRHIELVLGSTLLNSP